jgi:2-polyprenyl-3-methyl-5-hydroxy-6-metoxy-1,4-benzoquinol methylase
MVDPTSEPLIASACPRCAAAGELVHAGLVDRHFSAPGRWSFRSCGACELVWLDPRPRADQGDDAYRDYYTHGDSGPGGFEALLKRAVPAVRLGYEAPARERMLGWIFSAFGPLREIGEHGVMWLRPRPGGLGGKSGRLLDVGCGSGAFLAHMKALGWEVAGVEPDGQAARAARDRLGGATIHASLEGSDAPAPASFDAVTLSHVVEHLPHPGATLAGCFAALRPGGRLAIATPNAAALARTRFGAAWLHWDPPRHLQIYSQESLRGLVEAAGFEVSQLFTSAGSSHFVWRASWAIERSGRLPGIRLDGLPLRASLGGLAFWIREHRRVRAGAPVGEELVVIATRPAAAAPS